MKDGYYLHFRLNMLPDTTNASFAKHHFARKKTRDHIKLLVMREIGTHRPSTPLKRVTLIYVRGSATAPDYDGLVSSFKHVQDALVECGIMVSDKMSVTGAPVYEWRKTKRGEGYCEVTLLERAVPCEKPQKLSQPPSVSKPA